MIDKSIYLKKIDMITYIFILLIQSYSILTIVIITMIIIIFIINNIVIIFIIIIILIVTSSTEWIGLDRQQGQGGRTRQTGREPGPAPTTLQNSAIGTLRPKKGILEFCWWLLSF